MASNTAFGTSRAGAGGTSLGGGGSAGDAARVAAQSEWVERLGKLGFAAKGVLYLTIAAIAGSVGFAGGGGEASQQGAIRQLAQESYGTVLLVLLAIGLAGYALLRLVHVFTNPSGEDGVKGAVIRTGYGIRAVAYGALTVFTISILMGSGGGGSGGGQQQELVGRLLELPAGAVIVGGIAAVMVGVGLYQLYQAFSADFMEHITRATGTQRSATEWLGRAGHAARAAVFGTIGFLYGQAAVQADPSEAGGVSKALQTIAGSGLGTGLLTIAALGLAAYGAYSFAVAVWGTARRAG